MKQAKDIVIEQYKFEDDGSIPNHPSFPLLVYKNVLTSEDDPKDVLAQNNWLGAWRGIVATYHHYHSNSHEVLVAASGSGRLLLGGEQGAQVNIQQGDTIILPADLATSVWKPVMIFLLSVPILTGKVMTFATAMQTNDLKNWKILNKCRYRITIHYLVKMDHCPPIGKGKEKFRPSSRKNAGTKFHTSPSLNMD